MVDRDPVHQIMRRVAGYHDVRMDGISDLVLRARGSSVLDVACNRGLVGYEFANNGAVLVHGVDTFEEGIATARQLFADLRNVQARHEVSDLTKGRAAFDVLQHNAKYDIVLVLGIVHKLIRVMKIEDLRALVNYLGSRTGRYLAWRGNDEHLSLIDESLGPVGLKRVQLSHISELGPAGIWARA